LDSDKIVGSALSLSKIILPHISANTLCETN